MNEKHLIWAKKQYEKISDLQHDLELLNNAKKNVFHINITIDTGVANEQFKSSQLNSLIKANVKVTSYNKDTLKKRVDIFPRKSVREITKISAP